MVSEEKSYKYFLSYIRNIEKRAEIIHHNTNPSVKHINKHSKKVFYNIRDKILLFTKNISTNQLSKKLVHKMISSFKVIRKKNILLELQPSEAMKIYNGFYSNFFKKP